MKIIKIYDFPPKAKKFWHQEARFEPPVARTLCFTRLFSQEKIRVRNHLYQWFRTLVVGVSGFEPEASWTRTKRDTKLRHTPIA